jgi:threonine synthase
MTGAIGLRCVSCDARYPLGAMHEGCPACATDSFRSGLTPDYDYDAVRQSLHGGPLAEPGIGLWRYRRLLPVLDRSHEVSLGEGATALLPMPGLAREADAAQIWLKDESRNPTWSFKDRHAAVTISKANELGAEMIMASSSGNHGAALAAYAARAGIGAIVLSYAGLSEAASTLIQAYGATLAITTREGRWAVIREGIERFGWYPATNFTDIPTNGPYGHEGYKAIAFELHEQLGGLVPDYVLVPTAYAEGLFGIWKGFDELRRLGLAERIPRMVACEPAGGPLAEAWKDPSRPIAKVDAKPTVARGIGGSVNSYLGIAALRGSDGLVAQASDEEILGAQAELARQGIFAEPAAAASLACLRALRTSGGIEPGATIVLISTSSGLKHLAPVVPRYPAPVELPEPTLAALAEAVPAVRDAMSTPSRAAAEHE